MAITGKEEISRWIWGEPARPKVLSPQDFLFGQRGSPDDGLNQLFPISTCQPLHFAFCQFSFKPSKAFSNVFSWDFYSETYYNVDYIFARGHAGTVTVAMVVILQAVSFVQLLIARAAF